MIREHKIPTILGLSVLIIGLAAGIFLVQTGGTFFLKAAPEITPTEVKATNIADTSFSVSWITAKETTSLVKFGETADKLDQTAADDRDQATGNSGSFLTHHIALKNLKPQTRYFFKLVSQGKTFDNSGKPYEITTAQTPNNTQPTSDLASGKIKKPDGQAAEGAIVYLSMNNMSPQSVIVDSQGAWFIPLSTALSGNLAGFALYDRQAQVEEIFVQAGALGTATAITTTGGDNPIPEIVLGKTYDFRQQLPTEEKTGVTPAPTTPTPPPSSKFSFTELGAPTLATEAGQLAITNPTAEGEKINTQKPEFRGTAPAGKTIQILVESPQYQGTVTTAADGSWAWTPPANLSPGEHKITITYLGKKLTRTFTVLAAEASGLPAFTATPSASLTPTKTPTPTPTPRLTPTPTPKLTPTLSPTPTSTASARTAMPATSGGVPSAGDLTPTFWAFIMGVLLTLSGLIFKKLLAHA